MNYSTLQSDVAGYLHRADLTTPITKFIDQARLRIGGDLRALCNHVTGSVTSFSAGRSALPANYAAMAAVSLDGRPLLYMPPAAVAVYGDLSGVYSVDGGDLVVPGAGSTASVDVSYYTVPAKLVAGADVSEGMDEWPQLWLFQSVYQGALYTHDFELAGAMDSAYNQVLEVANRAGRQALYPQAAVVAMDVRGLAGEALN